MVVGSALPEPGSDIVLGISISAPSTFTLIFSIGVAGFNSMVVPRDILHACRHLHFLSDPSGVSFFREPLFVRRPLGDKLVLELAHETLHRPAAPFAKGANRAPAGNVAGNL